MKITVESSEKLVEFEIGGATVPARLWEGHTETGVPVHCYIVRISPLIPAAELSGQVLEEFSRSLREQKPPSEAIRAIPLRMIL